MLQVGQPAPSFSLPDANLEMMDLSSYRGKKNVVLYFYP
ncbi:MAG TPA: redoxin domain-containing protein, partial [Usitatibacter sp.]|nr:redoxin domain-containing protein [Usitatibacter sp.]